MAITSLMNQKGGSGKTTVCRTLGEAVSARGRKVLLIDNDPQGNVTRSYFGGNLPEEIVRRTASVTGKGEQVSPDVSNTVSCYDRDARPQPYKIHESLYLIGATKALADVAVTPVSGVSEFAEKVTALSRQFEDILIDCPPGASVLQAAAHSASEALLLPTFLNEDNVEGVYQQRDTMNARQQAGHPTPDLLGVVVSAKRTHNLNIEAYYFGLLQNTFQGKLFNTVISHSVKIPEARAMLQSIVSYAPNSVQARQYQSVADEYLARVEAKYSMRECEGG